ncbi:MAG: hypothetical protein GF364_19565 [Candidatus Lokiarchaeota archaeon]|nr:hypothetical protein [Candidatus Lokiarchaeota archaeon]
MTIEKSQRDKMDASKKILVLGLDNGGKTSIILSLNENSTIQSLSNILPTFGLKFKEYTEDNENYYIWDFGGQKRYRDDYLRTFSEKLAETKQLIYVFDVQDLERYTIALNYFQKILEHISEFDFELLVYLHKYDPYLEENPYHEINKSILKLIEDIKKAIPEGLNYKIFKTCILTSLRKLPVE